MGNNILAPVQQLKPVSAARKKPFLCEEGEELQVSQQIGMVYLRKRPFDRDYDDSSSADEQSGEESEFASEIEDEDEDNEGDGGVFTNPEISMSQSGREIGNRTKEALRTATGILISQSGLNFHQGTEFVPHAHSTVSISQSDANIEREITLQNKWQVRRPKSSNIAMEVDEEIFDTPSRLLPYTSKRSGCRDAQIQDTQVDEVYFQFSLSQYV